MFCVSWTLKRCPLCFPGMNFHEDLSRLGEKEGLKGRKLSKAVESFTWNITVLKVPKIQYTDINTPLSCM